MSCRLGDQAAEAARVVRQTWPHRPRLGVILGTGLGGVRELLECEARLPYAALPRFSQSTAQGHCGQLLCGKLAGIPTLVMDGRCHLYEGYPVEQLQLPIYMMARLGAEILVISNASGGLNPQFRTGDLMVLRDHLSFMPAELPFDHELCQLPFCRGPVSLYDQQLGDFALATARRHNIVAHQGVYVGVLGPNYETRAEYRMFRRLGGDVVGMSTIPEAIMAARCGIRTLGISVVTNVAKPDAHFTVSSDEVVSAAAHSSAALETILMAVARHALPQVPRESAAASEEDAACFVPMQASGNT